MLTIEQRLSRLEKQVTRYQLLSGVLAMTIVGALLAGATTEPSERRSIGHTVRTNRLEIVNDKGVAVLALDSDTAGGRLALCDFAGEKVVQARAEAGGGAITVGPKSQKPLISLKCGKEGGELSIANDLALPCVRMNGREFGGQLDLLDTLKRPAVSLAAGVKSGGRMALFNQDGQCVFTALASPLQGQILLGDAQGTPIWRAP